MTIQHLAELNIHDNGGIPAVVRILNNTFEVGLTQYDEDAGEIRTDLVVLKHSFERWFYGCDPLCGEDNNTAFFHLKDNDYLWIGNRGIIIIVIDEPVKSFISILGPNDVPYPYVITNRSVYLLLEGVKINLEDVSLSIDPYQDFYDGKREILERTQGYRRTVLFNRDFELANEYQNGERETENIRQRLGISQR